MERPFSPSEALRGSDLLLRHCASPLTLDRPPARDRVGALIGHDLARLLVGALANRFGRPPQLRA